MLVHTQQWENFVLNADFKITPHCNSGIFVRTSPLTPRPGKDVGYNGIEIAIDDISSQQPEVDDPPTAFFPRRRIVRSP